MLAGNGDSIRSQVEPQFGLPHCRNGYCRYARGGSIATMAAAENAREQMLAYVQDGLKQDSSPFAAWAKDLLRGSR